MTRFAQRLVSMPPEFGWLEPQVKYLHQATVNELAGSCPKCGGDLHKDGSFPDRFRIFTKGKLRGWCRKCGHVVFPDSNQSNWKPDPDLMRRWQDERIQQYEEQKHMAERALDNLAREKRWIEWHDTMDERAREMWEQAGIPRDWQDFWQLGYTDSKQFEYDGHTFVRPSLTIPKFDFGWACHNIDFRLINPPIGVGKYRPLANLPACAYNTTPQLAEYQDEVFVVEGSKKAMVVSIWTGEQQKQVIGLPSCNSWAGMEEVLRPVGRVWVIFDPDATEWAVKFAKEVGKNARVVTLPHKPDDAIMSYGLSQGLFRQALRQAFRV